MNFLGVGPLELIVILVVALIFVGPERLPRLAADLARTIREIRKYTGSLAAEFNEVIQDIEKETVGERSEWKEIGEGLSGATKSVTDALRGARADMAGTDASAPAAAPNGATPMPDANAAPTVGPLGAPAANGANADTAEANPAAPATSEQWITIAERGSAPAAAADPSAPIVPNGSGARPATTEEPR